MNMCIISKSFFCIYDFMNNGGTVDVHIPKLRKINDTQHHQGFLYTISEGPGQERMQKINRLSRDPHVAVMSIKALRDTASIVESEQVARQRDADCIH